MAASSLCGAGMRQQGLEMALQTRPSAQSLLHITKVPSCPCPWGFSRLSPFLSR